MSYRRRDFLAGTSLLASAALLGRAGFAQDSGRAPVTRAQIEEQWQRRRAIPGRFACAPTSETPEGPFYYPSSLRRRVITEGHPGLRLRLAVTVAGVAPGAPAEVQCGPLPGAIVDVWQTDAEGFYSNVGSDIQTRDTSGATFLRGHQETDDGGVAELETIVPGWEIAGIGTPAVANLVAPHIHVKVFHSHKVVTTTIVLPNELMDEIYADVEPYKSNRTMTAPGLDRYYERARLGANEKPIAIQHEPGGLLAKVTIGLAESLGLDAAPLFR